MASSQNAGSARVQKRRTAARGSEARTGSRAGRRGAGACSAQRAMAPRRARATPPPCWPRAPRSPTSCAPLLLCACSACEWLRRAVGEARGGGDGRAGAAPTARARRAPGCARCVDFKFLADRPARGRAPGEGGRAGRWLRARRGSPPGGRSACACSDPRAMAARRARAPPPPCRPRTARSLTSSTLPAPCVSSACEYPRASLWRRRSRRRWRWRSRAARPRALPRGW